MKTRFVLTLLCGLLATFNANAETALRIGFLQPSAHGPHHAAALAFAKTIGNVVPLYVSGTDRAPEECDVIWFHDGDGGALLNETNCADLRAYLDGGGALLLSGAAGRLLNELSIEPTALRVLGVSPNAFVSGIRVLDKHRNHPAFAGLDATKPVLLTTRGCNALADFHGTAGPHGELLANGSGPGERPLVEYRVGAGRVIFVGWRLADFTTATDAHRPNLERLFTNLLRYLASQNQNRARLIAPTGKSRYERRLGVPFLLADKPVTLTATVAGEKTAVVVNDGVQDMAVTGTTVSVKALALTLMQREKPVAQFVAQQRPAQDALDRRDAALLKDVRVEKPSVTFVAAPLKPLEIPRADQSLLLGRSLYQAPGGGWGDVTPAYEPVEDGGFRITGGKRQGNRLIVHGQNRITTGDLPVFTMGTAGGVGVYENRIKDDEKIFPLWPRPDAHRGGVWPCMGRLQLGVPGPDGQPAWLHQATNLVVTTTFRPGYTEYRLSTTDWNATLRVAPALDFHGMICQVEFERDTPLVWRYGGIYWRGNEANSNRVEIAGNEVRITEAKLPNGLVLAGWDGDGEGRVVSGLAEFKTKKPRRVYHVVATWGVTAYDKQRAQATMARLDTPNAAAWPEARDRLKQDWFDAFIGRALEPEKHFRQLMAAPEKELGRTCEWWDRRRAEFQIRTPDPHLNALLNWERCRSEYHRQGPGMVLAAGRWEICAHISVGWYGKEWSGDHAAVADHLRLHGALQEKSGAIGWIAPSLGTFMNENNTPYWVDHIWRHYSWTGDRQFIKDLWPAVKKAVAMQRRSWDRDGDGLFADWYEYWNCDSNGKGPKAAAPSAMNWAMLDRAARMAVVVGDETAAQQYRALADKSRAAIFRELWRKEEGRLGSIGADGLWRGHPQTWEEYLAANADLLSPDQSRSAMRWLAAHYGFQPRPGVQLLSCSDWWPVTWSVQWVPVGDTLLAALAGLRAGDADLWWPYIRTAVGSAFKSDTPGIRFGISNPGAGGGDIEDIDAVDPHTHLVVRGLFGIEPALHEGRIEICPAFPSDWTEASIRTPDVSYQWRREGDRATFRIRTPKPVVKQVRANRSGKPVATPAETESVVTVVMGEPPPSVKAAAQPTMLLQPAAEKGGPQPPGTVAAPSPPPATAVPAERQVLFDLSAAFNTTQEGMVATVFMSDYGAKVTIGKWWHNRTLELTPMPRVVEEMKGGLRFLTAGRPLSVAGAPPKSLLALSSWPPYPFPAAAVIPVGRRCEKLCLLLQSYVHSIKNYIPNGEVVLHYAGGGRHIESLVPPYNLDCYYQHFSLKGRAVPLGKLGRSPPPWSQSPPGLEGAHADVLEVVCDPGKTLESVEIRATCSEGVLGVAGLTVLEASRQ
ncbi:MAG: hypothetical protein FJ395_20385 [Verrucomicrobia bacterium]|nr:hypothetical protein [Verrucomicrobiota bacterium]